MHLLLRKSSLSDSSSRYLHATCSDLEGPSFIFLPSYCNVETLLLNSDAVAPPTVLIIERLCIFINVTDNIIFLLLVQFFYIISYITVKIYLLCPDSLFNCIFLSEWFHIFK